MDGDADGAHIHMAGLERMVAHAGGMGQIKLHPIVREAVYWYVSCLAIRLHATFTCLPPNYLSTFLPSRSYDNY
jgi:hypothetical protein